MQQAVSVIANLFGISEFRAGRQILRDEKRWRIGELNVSHAWHASIMPSFHDHAVVAVAKAEDTEFRGKIFPGFFRVGIAIMSRDTSKLIRSAIAEIDHDHLLPELREIDLGEVDDSAWLDGIGYELYLDSRACEAKLRFFNPNTACFRRVEKGLIAVASCISEKTRDPVIHDYMKMWRGYLQDADRGVE